MGGKYDNRDTDVEDPDDLLNDEYFKNNYHEESEDLNLFMEG